MRDSSVPACLVLPVLLCAIAGCNRASDDPNDPQLTAASSAAPPLAADVDPARIAEFRRSGNLAFTNGWLTYNNAVVWGLAQHNGWWAGYRRGDDWWSTHKVRTNITRRDPDGVGPGKTEDLDRLTDAMLAFGYPGFEHNFGLWYDRRRDAHDIEKRMDAEVVPPFLEQPWARSDSGRAWDGLPRYDLEKFNAWYFDRLREFAELSDRKGTVLLFNFYMQHALLETQAHYVDFPWRPENAVQDTGMPDGIPAANHFYDVSHPHRRHLHRIYIEKCLDELGEYASVIFLLGQEYTGPLEFAQFWLDSVLKWEQKTGTKVKIALGAPKDVLDPMLKDPMRGRHISVLDLRYWWILPDGSLHAPPSGQEVPGRYAGGYGAARTTAERIYEQVLSYRLAFPNRAILHSITADSAQTWAFFMAGGSMLVQPLGYETISEEEPWQLPEDYVAVSDTPVVRPVYELLRDQLRGQLHDWKPCPHRVSEPHRNWCLHDPRQGYLVYLRAGTSVKLDLTEAATSFAIAWIDPVTGDLSVDSDNRVSSGTVAAFTARTESDRVLLLRSDAAL